MELTPTLILNLALLIVPPVALRRYLNGKLLILN